MVRGFISGIIWGAIISVVVGGAASLFAPLPGREAIRNKQVLAIPETPVVAPDSDAEIVSQPGTAPAADPAPETDAAPSPAVSDDMAPETGADTTPAPQPLTGAVDTELQAPQDNAPEGGVSVQSEAPVQPQSDVTAPAAPNDDSELSISTDPVQPMMPATEDSGPAFPVEDTSEDPVEISEIEETDVTPGAEDPESEAAPQVLDTAPSLPSVGDGTEAGAETSVELQPSVGEPAGSLKDSFPQLQSSRLPSVGDETAPVERADTGASVGPGKRPVTLFAAPFSNPDNKPVMAIILIDEGDTGMDADVLSGFPYPLTFALNTLETGVQKKMEAYRSRGFEVMAMVDLPEFANASDVEIAMPAHLQALPEAVAVLEGPRDGLQGSKELSSQVAAVLGESGHGLVMLPKGLNVAQKLAARDGVPSASVFRDFDGKKQNAAAIRRFLDQAAFKAGQEGGVIMLGRLRPDTVSALLLWGLADRAGTVSLAPVSALLNAAK